jgi:hypothetical protein
LGVTSRSLFLDAVVAALPSRIVWTSRRSTSADNLDSTARATLANFIGTTPLQRSTTAAFIF